MPWDKTITLSFAAIPPNSPKNGYLGSWNKLLNILFPPTTDFIVHPHRFSPEDNGDPAADFIPWFEIKYKNLPVLIAEVATPSALDPTSARGQANIFMRDRLRYYARKFVLFYFCFVLGIVSFTMSGDPQKRVALRLCTV